ncbi:MAG: oligosaccharide flippase family protein [Candidatus Kapabacteria bacterium]|nr:oligosaccharide flippase family protein [Candidatus Kapabacteria bacterium]
MKSRILSLASDTLVYGAFTVFGRFLTFFLTPIYSNYLTVSENGEITYIYSLLAFMNIILSIGMDSAFFRFYKKDDIEHNRLVFSHSYISILIFSLSITLLIIINSGNVSLLIPELKNSGQVILLAALIPFLDSLIIIPFSLLRMERKALKFSLTRLANIIVAIILNIIFVIILRKGIYGVFLAQVLASLTSILIVSPELKQYLRIKIDKNLLKDMFKFGLPTIPAALSSIILQVVDRPILMLLTDSYQVGIYSVNYKLGIPMMILVAVFEYAWKPFYLSRFEDKDAKELFSRILTFFIIVSSFVFLGTVFLMDFIVRLPFIGGKFINPAFWVGMDLIPMVLTAYFFNGMFINYACGPYITKKTNYLPIAIGTGAILKITFNFILIPYIGYYGAGISSIIGYFASAAVLLIINKKIYPIQYNWSKITLILVFTLIFYLLGIYLTKDMELIISLITRLGLILAFGATIILSRIITKDEIGKIKTLFFKRKS